MDKIFITDLLARGVIGVYDWERERPQEIRINLTLYVDLRAAGKSDNLDDSLSYSAIALQAQALAETVARQTVEALAADLARLCLQDRRVQKVLVRVEKPGVVRFTRSVGVEIERTREDFD